MKRYFRYIFLLFLTIGIYVAIHKANMPSYLDLFIYDNLTNAFYEEKKDSLKSTVVVEIDDDSLKQLGQWPWSRIVIAKMIEEISKARPAVIGLDVIFSEPDRTSPKNMEDFYKKLLGIDIENSKIPQNLKDNDRIFAHAIKQSNTILPIIITNEVKLAPCAPSFISSDKGEFAAIPLAQNFICNLPILQNATKNSGFINAMINQDGFMRKYNLVANANGKLIPSFALAMLQAVDANLAIQEKHNIFTTYYFNFLNHKIISNEKAEVLNHVYLKENFTRISASKILSKEIDSSVFTGKFVLFGSTAIGLSDRHMIKKGTSVPGIFAHASFLENLFNDSLLFSPQSLRWILLLVSFVCSLVLLFIVLTKKYLHAGLLSLVMVFASLAFAWFGMFSNIYLPIGYFIFPLLTSYIIMLFILSFVFYMEEKEFMSELMSTRTSIINSMMMIVESRDTETGKHILRTKKYAKLLAEYLAKNSKYKNELTPQKIELIYQATPLHDIGKIGIPDQILQKPGKLDNEEMDVMKEHSSIGYRIIYYSIDSTKKDTNKFLQVAANIAHTHHERWDGTGYPLGLKGENIPIEGRIVALVDVYDALISRRCYKEAMGFEDSESIIEKGRGSHFDPIVLDAFLALKEEFREIARKNAD